MALLLDGPVASAGAIHRHGADAATATATAEALGVPATRSPVFAEWSRYLLADPAVWSKVAHPPYTEAVRAVVMNDVRTDPGGTEAMVSYLLWKQSLDPTRFDYYHPRLGPALRRIELSRTTTSVAPPSVGPATVGADTSPPPTSTPPELGAQNLNPPSAPEPSALLIVAGMTAWLLRRNLGRRAGDAA